MRKADGDDAAGAGTHRGVQRVAGAQRLTAALARPVAAGQRVGAVRVPVLQPSGRIGTIALHTSLTMCVRRLIQIQES